jgi:L-seryl-tRNA(Ser) seleniumtransferase
MSEATSSSAARERNLPSVDRAVRAVEERGLGVPRALLVRWVRRELAAMRAAGTESTQEEAIEQVGEAVEQLARGRLTPVINATGVIIHTNLGRAPLGAEAVEAVCRAAGQYTTLEYDREGGERGRRGAYLEELLAALCEAEAATVVNNCAAALVLMLRHFTAGERKQVLISRGELVQIGGGFRVPEILEASGAQLREVGTTNRTSAEDYARGITPQTGLILKVHRSNFWMEGFVESPTREQLAALALDRGLPFVEDLGSGATALTSAAAGVTPEPTPASVLSAGTDLVCFSGDKLFGGPQAGVIAGNAAHVAAIKKEPLFRALRCDKLVMAGLEATAAAHLRRAGDAIPVVSMIGTGVQQLHGRASAICESLGKCAASVRIMETAAQVGGGSLPQAQIASVALQVTPRGCSEEELARRLRLGSPCIVAYRAADALRLDLRTVFPEQDAALAQALRKALAP